MEGRWTNHCDETQNANRLPDLSQLSPAASSPYYQFTQDLEVSSISPQALHWGSSAAQRAMPPRAKANKVTKFNTTSRRGSRQSSLLSNVQDNLGQYAQQGHTHVNSGASQVIQMATGDSSSHLDAAAHPPNTGEGDHGATSMASLQSSIQHAFDARGFRLGDDYQISGNARSPEHSSFDNNGVLVKPDNFVPNETAADVVLKIYQSIKIDSTLCKKLAGEPARREPTQRRRDQKLNISRRGNVEALLAHVAGEVAPRPCKNCHKGHGPWNQCVVYEGQMCGSCTNCWFNASGSRCTFHRSNNPHHTLFTPTVQTPSMQSGAFLDFTPLPLPSNSPTVVGSFQADVAQWDMADATRRMVNSVMSDTMTFSTRERYLARIEAAARELGMRLAEYDEFLQTPEGIAEQQREQRCHLAQQNHPGDVSMDEDSPGAPLG